MPDSRDRASSIRVVLAGKTGLGMNVVRRILESTHDLDVRVERELAALPRLASQGAIDVIVIAGDGRAAAWRDRVLALVDVPLILVYVDGHLEVRERRVVPGVDVDSKKLLAEIRRVTAATAATMARPPYERAT